PSVSPPLAAKRRADRTHSGLSDSEPGVNALSLPTISPQILQFVRQFCAADESVKPFPAAPDRNPPRFTIALPANEAAQLGHPAIEFAHGHLFTTGQFAREDEHEDPQFRHDLLRGPFRLRSRHRL